MGRQAHVEPDTAAAGPGQRAAGSIRPVRQQPTGRDPRCRRRGAVADLRLPAGRGVAGGVVLAGGPDTGLAWAPRSRPRRTRDVSRGRHRARHHNAARPGRGLAKLVCRRERQTDGDSVSGAVAQPDSGGRRHPRVTGPRPTARAGARAGTPGGQTFRRMGGSLPRRRRTRGTPAMTRAVDETKHVDELRLLEAEAVHIIREVVAELERPVLLFSAGKDSIVLLRLAEKAFRPLPLPFPVMHVDTGHNFDEVIEFRDRRVTGEGHRLIVASVQESIDNGRVPTPGPGASRNRAQTRTLLDGLEAGDFDAAFGGARRDEERARAKERILSFRDEFGQWDPRAQRRGRCTTAGSKRVSRCGCSRSATGPNSTSGAISSWKALKYRRFTTLTN